jgi:ribosome assembly protein YihI (activator of Der GTPase)
MPADTGAYRRAADLDALKQQLRRGEALSCEQAWWLIAQLDRLSCHVPALNVEWDKAVTELLACQTLLRKAESRLAEAAERLAAKGEAVWGEQAAKK